MKNMNPSPFITEGQIGKTCELLSARLRKSTTPSQIFQFILEERGSILVDKIMSSITEMVERLSKVIVYHVKVDRSKDMEQLLLNTERIKDFIDNAFLSMPRCESEEVDVSFFTLCREVTDDDLEKEYEIRGLKPADPYSLLSANECFSVLEWRYANGTHWKNKKGEWCFATFNNFSDNSSIISVGKNKPLKWNSVWWYGGVPK